MTKIILNNYRFYKLAQTGIFQIVLDYTNNGQTPIYDLQLSEVYIIFTTCFRHLDHIKQNGHGFRMIVEGQG